MLELAAYMTVRCLLAVVKCRLTQSRSDQDGF